jgi:FMN phosphatase YigB (HAD superfamily)
MSLLICDLDNTLYDWVGYFVPSFYAMVDVAVEIMECDRERLLNDFRRVHQKHHDSEQPFAILETETVKERYRGIAPDMVARILDPALHAFNSARKENLHLHQGVSETLEFLQQRGMKLVAHTESKLYGAVDRLQRLDLFRFFSRLYCRERSTSAHPDPRASQRWLGNFPTEKVTELTHHQAKPDPAVLLEICAAEGASNREAAYVGDSIARDVLMARRANVFSIWAAYGAEHNPTLYSQLVRISHWTSEDVEREQELKRDAMTIRPDYIAHTSFREVIAALAFTSP